MNNEHDEDNSQSNPNDFGSDPDVPVVPVPAPEHPHHPTIEAQRSHHWPTANAWSTLGSLLTATATIVMVIVYIQIKGIMDSQGGQTQKLITASDTQALAAQKIADASNRNAAAAESFSGTASIAVEEFKRAAADSAKASQNAANNAEKSIVNAQQSLAFTIQRAELDQRPWVGLRTTNIVTLSKTEMFLAQVVLINSGKTPARNGRICWSMNISIGEWYGPPNPDKLGPCHSVGAIAPGTPLILTMDDSDKQEVRKVYEDIIGGKQFLYLWGSVLYWGLRGMSDPQQDAPLQPTGYTRFCLEYDWIQKQFKTCETGNDMQ